jgi:hypothetical protein
MGKQRPQPATGYTAGELDMDAYKGSRSPARRPVPSRLKPHVPGRRRSRRVG